MKMSRQADNKTRRDVIGKETRTMMIRGGGGGGGEVQQHRQVVQPRDLVASGPASIEPTLRDAQQPEQEDAGWRA